MTVWWITGCKLNGKVLSLAKWPFQTFLPGFVSVACVKPGVSSTQTMTQAPFQLQHCQEVGSAECPVLLSWKAMTLRCMCLYHIEKYVFVFLDVVIECLKLYIF